MAVKSIQVATNNATPVQLVVPGSGASQFLNVQGTATDVLPALFTNTDATNIIYIGNSTVSSSTGTPIFPKTYLWMEFNSDDAITVYAISAAATPAISVLLGRQ